MNLRVQTSSSLKCVTQRVINHPSCTLCLNL